MKTLVIAPEPFFSPRGTPFSVYYRTRALAELGVEIDLLTYGQGEDVEISGVRILRLPSFELLGPVAVGPSILKLFLDVFLAGKTLLLLLRHRYGFVHAHEESVFFCRFLKPLFGFKLVYDMHSSLPQQLTNFGFTRSRLLIRIFNRLELSCLRSADAVITISPALADYACRRMPDPERHILIENSLFDEVRLKDPRRDDGAVEQWQREIPADRPVVAYAGTFESYQGLEILIEALALVKRQHPTVFLLMIGGSPAQVEHYRDLARRHGLVNDCLFTGALPQADAHQLLERADVLASPRCTGSNTPLKVYAHLASGKPLVATRIPAHTQILDDRICFLAEPEPDAFADAIVAALTSDKQRRQVVEAARSFYADRFSREAYQRKVQALLEVLV